MTLRGSFSNSDANSAFTERELTSGSASLVVEKIGINGKGNDIGFCVIQSRSLLRRRIP
jgi:hypothetical protein